MKFTPTILCVDDDEDDLFFIKEAIQSKGYSFQIVEANDGSEAMAYLESECEKGRLPCLIIMDMNMPKMNGKQTIQKIRGHQDLSAIPVAVFTTSSNENDRLHFERQGIHFITKPYDYKVFNQQIVDLLAFCAAHSE